MSSRFRLLYLGLAAFLLASSLLGCDALLPWMDGEDQRTLQRCTPVASTEEAVGEWERLGLKGKVEAVAVNPCDPRVIYAGGTKRLFKSSDGGASWDTLYTLSNGEAVNIEVHPYRPDSIYAVHWHGVLRSTDGGRKWQTVFRAQLHRSTSALELGLKDPETLYVGTDGPMGGALYKSTNGGNSWNQLAENGRPSRISSIVLSPANSQIVYVQTSNYGDYGLFVSTNEGKTWTERGDRQAKFALVASPSDARTLYGVERGNMKIVRSQDGGKIWNAIETGLPEGNALRLAQDRRTGELFLLYVTEEASRSLRVYRRAEETWRRADSQTLAIPGDSIEPHVFARTFATAPDRSLYLGTKGGLYRMKVAPRE